MLTVKHFAAVAVDGASYGYDNLYSYTIPVEMEGKVFAGARVLIPFGKGNRKRIGVVLKINDTDGVDISRFKPLTSIIDKEPLLNDEMLELLVWLRNTTLCTYFEAFKTLIPIGLGVVFGQNYRLADEDMSEAELSEKAALLLHAAREDISVLDSAEGKLLDELTVKGFIIEENSFKRRKKDDNVSLIRLSDGYEKKADFSAKQREVVELLENCGAAAKEEIYRFCGVTNAVVKKLFEKGVLETYEIEVIRKPNAEVINDPDDIVLTEQQQAAYDGIAELIDDNACHAALLYGVTGSGKTLVFAKLIQHTLEAGRNVIMLIPEISLTPQVVERFQALFGDMVAIIHSSLSIGKRLNEYKRIKNGSARIVVGTRSAVFSPIDNIGLIIIDEEGERTYKSESSPRYNAKEIAKKRCVTHNATVLMASATPAIESYFYAKQGRYKLFEMKNRYSAEKLPDVDIIDLAVDGFYGNSSIFSEKLVNEINYNLEHKEQTILLLNRRGYHTYISCMDCREPLVCPNCSIPLTYHKPTDSLVCHYCGHTEKMIKSCPKCGSEHIRKTGVGTQKVEDEVARLFPDARVLRMDADTTGSRYVYEKNFCAFGNGEYDIMLGTQMIAKGLDFPNVTLVGVLSVDKSLYAGDFRSYERTFSLVTQAVGRCGRGEKQGRAVIQTYVPEHYVINLAAAQDYTGFYEQEIAARKMLLYPPFCDTCTAEFSSIIDSCAKAGSMKFFGMIKETIDSGTIKFPIRVLGPSKCSYEKINGKYRYRLIIKCVNNQKFRDYISGIYKRTFTDKDFANVQTFLDINGDIGV